MKLARSLCNTVSFVTCLLGVLAGLLFLFLLDRYGMEIMPDVFVERKIPVSISLTGICIALFVPYLIALVFSLFSLSYFKKENQSFLQIIRRVG